MEKLFNPPVIPVPELLEEQRTHGWINQRQRIIAKQRELHERE